MIDLINGIIQTSRFNCDSHSLKNHIHDKYIPNFIKLDTYYYTNPGIELGAFVSESASISFKPNEHIDILNIIFTSDKKDFLQDPAVQDLLKPLGNNLFKNEEDTRITWQMPYGEIMLSWDCWPDRHAFILMISYNHWDFLFNMKNSFTDIAWGMIKVNLMDDFCIYKARHTITNDQWNTEYCKLYATKNKCHNCHTNCSLNKMWYTSHEPTYKELLAEIPEKEYEEGDSLIAMNHAKMCGHYQSISFELCKNSDKYEIIIDGDVDNSYLHMQQLLISIDKLANIVSDWYNNFKSLT